MQQTIELNGQSSLPIEVMTAWQRQASLGMLVGLAALVNVAFNHAGASFAWSERFDWSQAMFGGLFAQASLLALWAGWGQQPITVRAPRALGLAALLGLAAAWGAARQSLTSEGELAISFLMVLIVAIQTVLLLLLHRRWGLQVAASHDRVLPTPLRFTLRQLLLWTTAAAALLALSRCIEQHQDVSLLEVAEMALTIAVVGPIVGMLLLPLVIASAYLALADQQRGWAAAWLAAMLVVTTALLFLIVFRLIRADMTGPPLDAAMEAAGIIVPFQVGVVATLLFGLVVIRCCGFRLSRIRGNAATVTAALDSPAASGSRSQRRWGQSRFAYVAAGAAMIVALLLRPAIVVEQARRENLRCAEIQDEWSKLGATVGNQGERIVSVRFNSGQPVAEQALARLCDPRHVETIRQLDFTATPLTDDQMGRIAALRNLETLVLDGTQITDAALPHLRRLSKLKVLNLAGTRISDEGLKALEGMSCLEGLCLGQTSITDSGLAHLQSLSGIASLLLAGTAVTDDGLQQLQSLQKLENLLLDNTKISDAGLGHLRASKSLKVVTLQGTQVSPQGAAEFYRTLHSSSGPCTAAAGSTPTN